MAKFLDEGHKVKITIMFRGREVFHPELGKRILDRIAEQIEAIGARWRPSRGSTVATW